MTAYNFGDVILVPFPFTDQSQAKQRPAVVVSSLRYNTERPDLILMAITSQVRTPATFGEVIVQHWQAAKLLKLSAIKPVFTTLDKRLVRKSLGRLHETDRASRPPCKSSSAERLRRRGAFKIANRDLEAQSPMAQVGSDCWP